MKLKKSFASFEQLTKRKNKKTDCFVGALDSKQENIVETDPRNVSKKNNLVARFVCDVCYHTFDLKVEDVIENEEWCPYCKNLKPTCKKAANCAECNKHTTLQHFLKDQEKKLAYYLGIKVKQVFVPIDPRESLLKRDKTYVFQCYDCLHVFELNTIFLVLGKWCPFCEDPSKLCYEKDCRLCTKRSFASYPYKTTKHKLKYQCLQGVYDNVQNKIVSIEPHKIPLTSTDIVLQFRCDRCHENFELTLGKVVNHHKWCQCCLHVTEVKLDDWFKRKFKKQNIIREFNDIWTQNKYYDFCFPEKKLVIELDGPHHFIEVKNGKNPAKAQENDRYKDKIAFDNGYSIIRVLQQDVIKDRNNWQQQLMEAINFCTPNNNAHRIMLYDNNNEVHNNELKEK